MNTDFGRQLKQYRSRKGWSQTKLLEELREEGYELWSKGTISKWENSKTQPGENIIETLEQILETPQGLLLSLSGHIISVPGQTRIDGLNQAGKAHDKEVYEKSDKIINENDFDKLFIFLRHNYFYDSQLTRILEFLEYFKKEGNKFADWHLNYLSLRLCQPLFILSEFIQVNSIERFHAADSYDRHGRQPTNKEFYELLKTL